MSLNEKLLEIQKAGIEGVVFDSSNPHFKNRYISLGSLLDKVLPVLNDKGIVVTQIPTATGPTPSLSTVFVDTESGERLEGTVPLVLQKDDPQGVGSAITYMRRYALLSMLGLVADEDDDGEAARTEPVIREVVNTPGDKKSPF